MSSSEREVGGEEAVVAVIDDDELVLDLYTSWLTDDYEVRAASSGEEALQIVDDKVDVIILDRRMPGIDGDDVLQQLRERGINAMVAMLSAVEPADDIVDLPFDDYIVKPTDREELISVTESLLKRARYNRVSQRCFRLASKLAVLDSTRVSAELDQTDSYSHLKEELSEAQQAADESIEDLMDSDAIVRAYKDL